MLETSDLVLRLRKLKQDIEAVDEYREHFKEILDFQKEIVRKAYAKGAEELPNLESWSGKIILLMSDPMIQEYLELVEILNDVIMRVRDILNAEITL